MSETPTEKPIAEVPGSGRLYDFTRYVTHPLFTLGFSFRYERAVSCPSTGPVLVIANHQSYLDPPLIGLGFERRLVYLARKSLFRNRHFASLIRSLNAVPIDQDSIGKDGIRAILEQLEKGHPVVVFPEGTRTPDGTMQPLRPGIHLLIKRVRAPILPVALAGAYDAWPQWRKYPIPSPLFLPPTPRTVALAVGETLEPKTYAEMPRDEAMRALAQEIAVVQARAEKLRRK